MARQPTSHVCIVLFMTIDTKPHFESFGLNPIHILDFSVAFYALDIFFDVPLVVEQNMLRNVEDLFPRRRGLGVEIFVLLLNPRMIGNDVVMTVETFFNRRQPRMNRPAHIRVAELALNRLDAGMDSVTERNGLFGSDIRRRRGIEKVQETEHQENNESGPEHRSPIIAQKSNGITDSGNNCRGSPPSADDHGQNQDRCQCKGGYENFHQFTSRVSPRRNSGNRFRKYITANEMRLKKPRKMKPSVSPKGREDAW